MKILITGSAGFIGYNFAKFLLKNTNHSLIGLDNLNNYYPVKIKKERLKVLNKFKKFKFFKLDLKDKDKLEKIFKLKINIVYHFAAQAGVRYSLVNPRAYVESNLDGFFNLIENIKKYRIGKFFYASSSSVYGNSSKFPLAESNQAKPINIYGLTKKNNEEMTEIFFENSGIKCVGFRFFTVFGEWGRPDMLIYKYLESIFNKTKKFYLNNYGNHTRDFTYINDVCEVMYKFLEKKIDKSHQIFNICANNPIKITSVLKFIDLNFIKKPTIIKRKFQIADVKKTHGDNRKIKKYLNKKSYTDIREALKNTCSWYKKNWKTYY